ncbi:MAG: ferritin family protein [Planctomycetota bacterium]|nr:ferritin family protein [Planctomycetota bacterium]
MRKWRSVDEVLDFAIGEEDAAAKFYTRLARKTKNAAMAEVLEGFAIEEKGHKDKLLTVKAGQHVRLGGKAVVDLRTADYVVAVKASPSMSYQDALIVAMKKEKAAFKLYTDLAASVESRKIKALFLALAQEEAKHKLRFEIEYDDFMEKAEQ